MASWEEASKCPRCSQTGDAGEKMSTAKPGISAVVVTCKNTGCKWYGTGWSVQINGDGSIPDARERKPEDREQHMFPRINPLLYNQRTAQAQMLGDEINRRATGDRGEV